jgi:sugar phosphate isomerase/epimerase
MVYGEDLLDNVRLLSEVVDCVEIALFHTPELHNIPEPHAIREAKDIGVEAGITFTVHLPASLEIASGDSNRREASIDLAVDILSRMSPIDPAHHILHIPFTPPTLVFVPGLYFTEGQKGEWGAWAERGLLSLERIQAAAGNELRLLVENINYSPSFLEPFWTDGDCGLCLDLGHLMLGREKVLPWLERCFPVTGEIHLHGVVEDEEHLSLSVLPDSRIKRWMEFLTESDYQGQLILEVFDPQDLSESLDKVMQAGR